METIPSSSRSQESSQTAEKKRPLLVTVICILGFIGAPIAIVGVLFNPSLLEGVVSDVVMPFWYSIFLIILSIFELVSLIYIWKMRRFGLVAYTGLAAVEYVVGFSVGFSTPFALTIRIIILGLLWTQYKKMF